MTINPLFKQLYNQEQVENKFWSLAELERSLQRDDTSIIILSCDNEIEGFLVYQNAFGEAELFFIYVFESHRGYGKSKNLMNKFIFILRAQSVRRIFLEVRESNFVAQKLYKAYDFKLLSKRQKYYKDGEAALIYEKVLCEK